MRIVRSRAPLRLGLGGGGTDVSPYSDEYGGQVFNATIDLFAHCTIEEIEIAHFECASVDHASYFSYSLDINDDEVGDLFLYAATYRGFCKEFGIINTKGIRVTTYSDVPSGSGLGGSSTLVISMIAAFAEFFNIAVGDYEIADLAYRIERLDVGIVGGKQDQFASAFGGFNFISFSKESVIVNPLRIRKWIVNELEESMLLYYTGIKRSASVIEDEKRNALKGNTSTLEAMHEAKAVSVKMKNAVLTGNISEFSRLLGLSWVSKKQMAKTVTNSTIDALVDGAIANGAISAKVSGAGGGGFMIFMVEPKNKYSLSRFLDAAGGKVLNFHFYEDGVRTWTL